MIPFSVSHRAVAFWSDIRAMFRAPAAPWDEVALLVPPQISDFRASVKVAIDEEGCFVMTPKVRTQRDYRVWMLGSMPFFAAFFGAAGACFTSSPPSIPGMVIGTAFGLIFGPFVMFLSGRLDVAANGPSDHEYILRVNLRTGGVHAPLTGVAMSGVTFEQLALVTLFPKDSNSWDQVVLWCRDESGQGCRVLLDQFRHDRTLEYRILASYLGVGIYNIWYSEKHIPTWDEMRDFWSSSEASPIRPQPDGVTQLPVRAQLPSVPQARWTRT